MDPISVGLLGAVAGGVGGEAGRQVWAGLTALVRRPFRRGDDTAGDVPQVSSGVDELVRLEESPADPARAQALSTALAVRAVLDADFRHGLEAWYEHAKLVRTGDGAVHNEISGGTQYGPVLQGRDFSGGLSFSSPSAPAQPPTAGQGPDHGVPPERG